MTNALPNVYYLRVGAHGVSPAAIILASTELPLALPEQEFGGRPLVAPRWRWRGYCFARPTRND